MVDKGIPPPDFGSDASFNPIEDQFMEEETDAFKSLMESSDKEQQKVQEETRKQVVDQEEALKQSVQKEEMEQASKFEEREKGIEEEDAKKTTEEEDLKKGEETRQSALKKGGQKQARRYEQDAHIVEENEKVGEEQNQQEIEVEDPLHTAKQLQGRKQRMIDSKANKDSARQLDHTLHREQGKIANKSRLEQSRREEILAEKKESKSSKKEGAPIQKQDKGKNIQSIAANMTLGNHPLQGTSPQKGQLDTSSSKLENRKELEKLAKQIMDEAEVLKQGDEIRTTITVDLPDSIFNKGKVTVSTFKYRPLEVNLKFENFNAEGSRLIRQNQGELKNVLKINSLNVHQLDVIE